MSASPGATRFPCAETHTYLLQGPLITLDTLPCFCKTNMKDRMYYHWFLTILLLFWNLHLQKRKAHDATPRHLALLSSPRRGNKAQDPFPHIKPSGWSNAFPSDKDWPSDCSVLALPIPFVFEWEAHGAGARCDAEGGGAQEVRG